MRRTHRVGSLGIVLLAACGGTPEHVGTTSAALTKVTLVDLGLGDGSTAHDINAAGTIVGAHEVAGVEHAFRLANGVLEDLHPAGYPDSAAIAINDAGETAGVTGAAVLGNLNWRAFAWDAAGSATMMGQLGTRNIAYGINALGQAHGHWFDANGSVRGFIWSTATGMIDLGDLGAGQRVWVGGINDLGHIVGSSWVTPYPNVINRAFHWYGGVMTALGTLGGTHSAAADVNENLVIVGSAQLQNGFYHACKWENGVITDLDPGWAGDSHATAVNNSGHAVGYRESAGVKSAMLWRDGVAIDLGSGSQTVATHINELDVVGGIPWQSPDETSFLWVDAEIVALPPAAGWSGTALLDLEENAAVGVSSSSMTLSQEAALWSIELNVPATNAAIVDLQNDIGGLVETNTLPAGLANALTSKLDGALLQCENGHEQAARNQLEAFIHQVEAFMQSGKLTFEQGQALLDEANTILSSLEC